MESDQTNQPQINQTEGKVSCPMKNKLSVVIVLVFSLLVMLTMSGNASPQPHAPAAIAPAQSNPTPLMNPCITNCMIRINRPTTAAPGLAGFNVICSTTFDTIDTNPYYIEFDGMGLLAGSCTNGSYMTATTTCTNSNDYVPTINLGSAYIECFDGSHDTIMLRIPGGRKSISMRITATCPPCHLGVCYYDEVQCDPGPDPTMCSVNATYFCEVASSFALTPSDKE